jgi:magnesium transporter
MAKFLKRRTKKIGLPPGSLPNGDTATGKGLISLIDYDSKQLTEKKEASLEECLVALNNPSNTWINIHGINNTHMIETIGKHFGLHPLLLEDIMTIGQRSKLDNYKDTLYIVVRMLKYNEEKNIAEDEQVSLVLGSNYLISFLETTKDVFGIVRERLRNPNSQLRRRKADYLCYSLIDCLVDNYFLILEKVDEKLEYLEEELADSPTPHTLQKIQHAKREIILLRKSIWPMREVISNFRRLETPLIQDATKLYIQDVYDHTIQAIDTIESFRDINSGMLEIYLSNISLRMNEIMKVLTIVATIFVPLTFIASFYGMNFSHLPGLDWKWSYFVVSGIMLLISLTMLYYFKRKNWF